MRLELKEFPELIEASESPVTSLLHPEYLNSTKNFRDIVSPKGTYSNVSLVSQS
jgi:hypothetical protein